jgi:hypothetical protein
VRREKLLPAERHDAVVTALYADAEVRGWATLSPQDRSRVYSQWVEQEHIGGVLCRYMTPEAARSWIKDGPMKEYARAQRGTGRYARFGQVAATTPIDIIRAALGPAADVLAGSEGVKPAHCRATRGDDTVYVTWGEASNFRNLLWAALRAAVAGADAHIVVLEPPDRVSPTEQTRLHGALGQRCGVGVHHLQERHPAPSTGDTAGTASSTTTASAT